MSYDNRNSGALFQTTKSDELEGPFTLADNAKGTVLASKCAERPGEIEVTILDGAGDIVSSGTMFPYANDKENSPTHKATFNDNVRYVLFDAVKKATNKRFKQIKLDTSDAGLDLNDGW